MNESTIYKKLNTNFKPSFLKVENESHLLKTITKVQKEAIHIFMWKLNQVFLITCPDYRAKEGYTRF